MGHKVKINEYTTSYIIGGRARIDSSTYSNILKGKANTGLSYTNINFMDPIIPITASTMNAGGYGSWNVYLDSGAQGINIDNRGSYELQRGSRDISVSADLSAGGRFNRASISLNGSSIGSTSGSGTIPSNVSSISIMVVLGSTMNQMQINYEI